MVKREVVIKNKSGLESKPAALFIQKASNYKSEIWIEKGERKANAKSLLGVMSLSISSGTNVVIIADGDDEGRAIAELEEYLNSGLEESV